MLDMLIVWTVTQFAKSIGTSKVKKLMLKVMSIAFVISVLLYFLGTDLIRPDIA